VVEIVVTADTSSDFAKCLFLSKTKQRGRCFSFRGNAKIFSFHNHTEYGENNKFNSPYAFLF
jgi:hypothetical protein